MAPSARFIMLRLRCAPGRPRTLVIGSFNSDLKWRGSSLRKTQIEIKFQSQQPIQLKPYTIQQPVEELLDKSIQKVTGSSLFRTAAIASSFSHIPKQFFKTHYKVFKYGSPLLLTSQITLIWPWIYSFFPINHTLKNLRRVDISLRSENRSSKSVVYL